MRESSNPTGAASQPWAPTHYHPVLQVPQFPEPFDSGNLPVKVTAHSRPAVVSNIIAKLVAERGGWVEPGQMSWVGLKMGPVPPTLRNYFQFPHQAHRRWRSATSC